MSFSSHSSDLRPSISRVVSGEPTRPAAGAATRAAACAVSTGGAPAANCGASPSYERRVERLGSAWATLDDHGAQVGGGAGVVGDSNAVSGAGGDAGLGR